MGRQGNPVDASTNRGKRELRDRARFGIVIDRSGADPLWFTSLFSQHTDSVSWDWWDC